MKPVVSRRQFLARSGQTAAAVAALGAVHTQAALKPEPIQLGIVGCGGMMGGHVREIVRRKLAVSFAHFCDVDPRQVDKVAKMATGFQSTPGKRTPHFEDVINDPNVDALIIATPHHWHAPMAMAAFAAGKDAYIEKPISHVYAEGTRIIEAAKKYGRVVQQGSQTRSSVVATEAGKLLKEGIIGEVKVARAWTAETRRVRRPEPNSQPPAGVDYDRWLGPAPKVPFNSLRYNPHWRLFRAYGNGEIGDDGIHDVDMARWGLGDPGLPKRITARGSTMLLHGHYSEFPDNMNVTFEYPDGRLLVYENYPFAPYGLHGFDNGNVFYGTEGYMVFSRRGKFQVYMGKKGTPGPSGGDRSRAARGYGEHMDDFLQSVRDRSPTKTPAEVAHGSCALVHLGEIAYRVGRQLEFDAQRDKFVDAPDADAMLTKAYREPYGLM